MSSALYLLAAAVFAMGTSEFMLSGLLPAIAADLAVPLGTAGLLTSAFAIGMVVGAPLMAATARSWPRKRVLIMCLLVFTACHAAGAATDSFALMLALRVLSALANAGFLAIALSAAAALAPEHLKGRAVAILLAGTTLATVAGVPAGTLLGNALGWRSTFWTVALVCLVAAAGLGLGLKRGALGRPMDVGHAPLQPELAALRSRPLITVIVLAALVNAGTFTALTYLAPVITDTAGLPEAWVALSLMFFGLGSWLGVTVAGRLSDRHPGAVIALGGPLLVAVWVGMALSAAHPAVLLPLTGIAGLVSFGLGSTLIARVLYAATAAPSMGGSYATAALNVGATAGPALGAAALGAWPAATTPLWVAAGLTALTVAGATALGRALRGEAR